MSEKQKKNGEVANYGIQAESVTAGAMAVGKGATATQNIGAGTDSAMLVAGIADLRAALEASRLPLDARDVLNEDIEAIAAESGAAEPDRDRVETALKSLISKVKLAGRLTEDAAELIEPLKKIAAAIGLGAAAIGLL